MERIHIQAINLISRIMRTIFLLISLLISGETYTRLIPNITNPEQVIWEDMGHVIFLKDENIFEYDVFKDDMVKIGERKLNEFVGVGENGNLLLCEINHFIINSKDEFSTIFKINGKELKFFPTIQPISFRGDIIVAKTALDFLEQHYYEIHISDGIMKEIPRPAGIQSGLEIYEDTSGDVFFRLNLRNLLRNIFYELIYIYSLERV